MRKNRRLQEGAIYHVIARINRGEMLLDNVEIKDLFLAVVRRAKKRQNFAIKNFCIMGNHIHLMMQPRSGENLSRIMQWILSVFAIRYNRRFKIKGHVWYDRFKSHIIDSLRKFLRTFVYIAENPVNAGIVKTSQEFPWSGVNHMKQSRFDIIDAPDLLIGIFLSEFSMRVLLCA